MPVVQQHWSNLRQRIGGAAVIKRLAALALIGCLAFAGQAEAGITQIAGTGVGGAIANTVFSGTATLNMTTTHDIPIGSLIIVIAQGSAGSQTFSCGDVLGNGTYTAGQSAAAITNATTQILYAYTSADIPNGGTVTCSITAGSNGIVGTILAFSGSSATPFDSASATPVTGTGTGTVTIGPTGALNGPCSSSNCEVLVGANVWKNGGTVTNDASFTTFTAGGSVAFAMGFKIVNASTAANYAPSTVATSSNHAGQLQAFMAASSGAAIACRRALLGVGC